MDRERLKGLRQTDLTEGRVNQDFLDWMRTKGVSWLLALMIALVAYLLVVRWNDYRQGHRSDAWRGYLTAISSRLPSDLEDVASKYPGVGAVPELSRLAAARQLLTYVQIGRPVGAENDNTKQLTAEEREAYLQRADVLFQQVIDTDDGSQCRALITSSALNGRAAVAESLGQLNEARDFYERAAARVEKEFPELARSTRHRAATVDQHAHAASLPNVDAMQQQMQMMQQMQRRRPITLEPGVRELIVPENSTGSS